MKNLYYKTKLCKEFGVTQKRLFIFAEFTQEDLSEVIKDDFLCICPDY